MTAPSMDDFDFVNLLIHDVHGYPKGRMMSKKRLAGIVKNGLGLYGGLCFFGIRGEVSLHEDFGKNSTYVNKYLKPLIHTLKPCPTLGQGKYKVGQATCRLEHMDGSLDTSTPRTAAEIQIKKLQTELGLTIKSAFEMEFNIRDSESKKYFAHVDDWGSINVLEHCQKLLFDMVHELDERSVHVDSLQTEHGPGQFELTIDVAEGIEAPEKTVECKNIIKSF
uniref:Lengsin n=1 Tax=Arion vulgaris TaxID=1028688 RepID=A0A0B7AKM0_9EUPU